MQGSAGLSHQAARLGVRTGAQSTLPSKYPEPLCAHEALPHTPVHRHCQWALPHLLRSYELMRRTKRLPSTSGFPLYKESLQVVVTPCCQLAPPDVISASLSPGAWTLTPVGVMVLSLVSSHNSSAFPALQPGRLNHQYPYSDVSMDPNFEAAVISLCSGPRFCSPPRSLPPLKFPSGRPWLLRPRISRFVTSPSSGYTNRPNRAIDGVRTFTLPDSRPCRPLLQ